MTRKGAKQPGENTDEVSQAVRQLKALCQDLTVLFHAVSHRNMLKIKILVCDIKHASRDGEFYKQWKNDLCISAIQIS